MRTILSILIVLMVISCRKQGNSSTTVFVPLESCRPAAGATLCLDSIQDSRCPPNANCVWAGVAIGYFTLKTNGQSYPVALTTQKIHGFPANDTTVAGFHLKFIGLTPLIGQPGTVTAEVNITQ